MEFTIYTLNDSGSGMEYHKKEQFLKEVFLMVDDCIANGGTYFSISVDSDVSCFAQTERRGTQAMPKKWIQIWYSWGDQESPIEVPEGMDAWEYTKKLAINEASVAQEMTDNELGIRFCEDEGKITLHYMYDDTYCYYQVTDCEDYQPKQEVSV